MSEKQVVPIERHPETGAEKAARLRREDEAKIVGLDPTKQPGYVAESGLDFEAGNVAPVVGVPPKDKPPVPEAIDFGPTYDEPAEEPVK